MVQNLLEQGEFFSSLLEGYSTLLTLTAGILLATNVVLGLSRRAAHHQQLKAQFMDLERLQDLEGDAVN